MILNQIFRILNQKNCLNNKKIWFWIPHFWFWIHKFWFWIRNFCVLIPKFWLSIINFWFWIRHFLILNPQFVILNPKFWFWITKFLISNQFFWTANQKKTCSNQIQIQAIPIFFQSRRWSSIPSSRSTALTTPPQMTWRWNSRRCQTSLHPSLINLFFCSTTKVQISQCVLLCAEETVASGTVKN